MKKTLKLNKTQLLVLEQIEKYPKKPPIRLNASPPPTSTYPYWLIAMPPEGEEK